MIPKTTSKKIALVFIFGAFMAIVLIGVFRSNKAQNLETGREIQITSDYLKGLESAGYQFTPTRGYEVAGRSGASVTIHQFDPAQTQNLRTSLERKFPSFTWRDVPAGSTTIGAFSAAIPPELLPNNSALLIEGKDPSDHFGMAYYIDSARGILYRTHR